MLSESCRRAVLGLALVAGAVLAGCASGSVPSTSPTQSLPTTTTTAMPSTAASSAQVPALVGQWSLDRTCAAIVKALKAAGHPELIPGDITELIKGVPENGPLPDSWDVKNPCANAKPPTEHSHTFWADGTFNSYDENGRQVDDGSWAVVDARHFTIGDATFEYSIDADELQMRPVEPEPCGGSCLDGLGWMYAVSYPGQTWTRVTSGAHVPPESVP
jgi:hypothetical protein